MWASKEWKYESRKYVETVKLILKFHISITNELGSLFSVQNIDEAKFFFDDLNFNDCVSFMFQHMKWWSCQL